MIFGYPYKITLHTRITPTVTITAVAGDIALNDISLPTGLNYTALNNAFLTATFRRITDTSAALNDINGNQYIQINDGTSWQNAILIPDNSLNTAASATGYYGKLSSETDIKTHIQTLTAAGATTISIQWHNALATGGNLILYDLILDLELIFVNPLIVG